MGGTGTTVGGTGAGGSIQGGTGHIQNGVGKGAGTDGPVTGTGTSQNGITVGAGFWAWTAVEATSRPAREAADSAKEMGFDMLIPAVLDYGRRV